MPSLSRAQTSENGPGQMFPAFRAHVFTPAAFICRTALHYYACYLVTSVSGNNGIRALDE